MGQMWMLGSDVLFFCEQGSDVHNWLSNKNDHSSNYISNKSDSEGNGTLKGVYVRVRVRVRKGSEMVLPNQGSTDFVRTPRP
jgi:hypothetical protein